MHKGGKKEPVLSRKVCGHIDSHRRLEKTRKTKTAIREQQGRGGNFFFVRTKGWVLYKRGMRGGARIVVA